jgi:hypothetical protein
VSICAYGVDGPHQPFDPAITRAQLAGCLLCCDPYITVVGVFVPDTAEMLAVVLRLRQHPIRGTSALAYGLCRRCMRYVDVTDRVEAAIVAAASRVTIQ